MKFIKSLPGKDYHNVINRIAGTIKTGLAVRLNQNDYTLFPYGYFLAFLMIVTLFVFTSQRISGDDIFFSKQGPFREFLFWRYIIWSSRLIPDSFAYFFNKLHPEVFSFLHIVFLANIPLSTWFLFKDSLKKELHWVVFMLCMTLGLIVFRDVGTITTAVNYSWPLSAMIFVFCVTRQLLFGKNINTHLFIITCFFTVFAANQEQICIVLCVVLSGALLWTKRRYGAFNIRIMILFLLCAGNLIFIVTTPGNANRYIQESARWYPDFPSLSLFYKAYLGFTTTFYRYFFYISVPYLAFAGVLGLALRAKSDLCFKGIRAAYAFIPFFLPLLLIFFEWSMGRFGGHLERTDYIADAYNYMKIRPYLALFIVTFLCLLILKLIYILTHEDKIAFLCIVAVLLLGAATRMMLGFSPTIFASGMRTFILMDFSWILAALIIICKTPEILERSLHGLLFPCVTLQLLAFHLGRVI